ncbi:MAG: hypothetical protein L7F77_14255, partial [Candidatus Magnetominusculus sp. LBB02]|nr:hypothetical protein [Candidatus Magnetominusculus sp. LBB02]
MSDNGNADTGEARYKLALVLFTIVMLGVGSFGLWIASEWTKDKAIGNIRQQARHHLELYNIYLVNRISTFSSYPVILAENSLIINSLNNPADAGAVNSYLSQFNSSVGANASYILNKDGVAVAASNWDDKDSFVGRDYSFRPYFKKAINGVPAGYAAMGVTSRKTGYYAAYPIRKDGVVIGVAVVKNKLDSLELGTEEIMGTLLIADENDVIFASNDDMFDFHTVHKLTDEVLSKIKESKQYGDIEIIPLPIKSDTTRNGAKIITLSPSDLTEKQQVSYVIETLHTRGWSVYLLSEIGDLDKKIAINMAIAASGVVAMFVVVLLLVNLRIKYAHKKMARNNKELEQKVSERTNELNETNGRLLVELMERKRLENALKIKTDELQNINEHLMELVEREVSASRNKEQMLTQQSRMAAMGEMIGSIAHQWRQHINAIGLIVQDLVDASLHGEMSHEYLETEVQSTMGHIGFMSQTIDDFRDFLKPSKKMLSFDVKVAIETIMSMFGGIFKKDNCLMSLENYEGQYMAAGYPNEFKQVVLNIVNNARDAIISSRNRGLLDRNT